MGDTISKVYLEWDTIHDLVDVLAEKIKHNYPNIDSVTGLARGGLIPAVLLSHKLDIPWTLAVHKNTLVVDDINDTGHTLSKSPGVYTAVLHHKPTSIFLPSVYAEEVGTEWIVYPWEREDSEAKQDYLVKENEIDDPHADKAYWVNDSDIIDFLEREDNSVVWSEEDSKLHTIGGLTNDKEGSFMKFQNKLNNKKND